MIAPTERFKMIFRLNMIGPIKAQHLSQKHSLLNELLTSIFYPGFFDVNANKFDRCFQVSGLEHCALTMDYW